MDSQRGDAPWDSLPEHVRQELRDVDLLREVWAKRRQDRTRERHRAARRELTRDRVREWGGGADLTELLLNGDSVSGEPLTGPHVAALAGRVAELPALSGGPKDPWTASGPLRAVLSTEHTVRLAEAAAAPAHPVVRAAHAYAECVRVAAEVSGGEPLRGGADWVLPWVLASRVLQRADLPPLLLDPSSPPPAPGDKRVPDGGLAPVVSHLAGLVTSALRDELAWHTGSGAPADGPVPPLNAVTRRRVLDHVRSRRGSVALLLGALDPAATATVTSGDGDRVEGPTHWWSCLELAADGAALALYVVVRDVGSPPSGVLAVTANARLTTSEGVRQVWEINRGDSVTVLPTDCVDDRWPQVRDLVDEAVSRSVDTLTRV
ncbi:MULTISPECIES: hypothetical protein [unclassified Nocardiopsis]|uniref:hypothetical protein n=1 Tax=unclassified Nocardiopsis TaxID=2649073 RepID=UPI00341087AC